MVTFLKKIVLAAVLTLGPLAAFSQLYSATEGQVDISTLTKDTVDFQPLKLTTVGGCTFSITFFVSGIDADDAVASFGGSNYVLGNNSVGSNDYYFSKWPHESLPFTLDTLDMVAKYYPLSGTNSTVYLQEFVSGSSKFNFNKPVIRFIKGSATTGTFGWIVNFYN